MDVWIDGAADRHGFPSLRGAPLLLAHKEHHLEPCHGISRYPHFTSLHNSFYTSTSDSLAWLGRKLGSLRKVRNAHRTDISKNVKWRSVCFYLSIRLHPSRRLLGSLPIWRSIQHVTCILKIFNTCGTRTPHIWFILFNLAFKYLKGTQLQVPSGCIQGEQTTAIPFLIYPFAS